MDSEKEHYSVVDGQTDIRVRGKTASPLRKQPKKVLSIKKLNCTRIDEVHLSKGQKRRQGVNCEVKGDPSPSEEDVAHIERGHEISCHCWKRTSSGAEN